MNVQKRISITEIVAATGLSRATVDRVLNKRPGVHPRTQAHVLRVLARLENDGQPAGFILGRCLERVAEAKVAVVVGYFSYLCQEDREIGFRSLLRQRFPQIEIVEVIKGDDSRGGTYTAALRLLKNRRDIAGIYNVAGGNFGLARAIDEAGLDRRPLYIGHEVNEVTEPLLRRGV